MRAAAPTLRPPGKERQLPSPGNLLYRPQPARGGGPFVQRGKLRVRLDHHAGGVRGPGGSHRGHLPGPESRAQESSPSRTLQERDSPWGPRERLWLGAVLSVSGEAGAARPGPQSALQPAPRGPWRCPAPPGNQGGGWSRGEMRGTCQNSLLTAKVTTLFPGPKRDNGRAGKVYIKADWVGSHPPSTPPLTP